MTRVCTVCTSGRREAIDRAVIATMTDDGPSYRAIACQFGVNRESLRRHIGECLVEALLVGWQAERDAGRDPLPELEARVAAWQGSLARLVEACDAWLRDPRDPERYSLEPRAIATLIHEDRDPATGQRRRRTLVLAEAIAAIERPPLAALSAQLKAAGDDPDHLAALAAQIARAAVTPRIRVVRVECRIADPRRLLIDAVGNLGQQLALLADLRARFAAAGAVSPERFLLSPEWRGLRARMLAALSGYPDAREALAGVCAEAESRQLAAPLFAPSYAPGVGYVAA